MSYRPLPDAEKEAAQILHTATRQLHELYERGDFEALQSCAVAIDAQTSGDHPGNIPALLRRLLLSAETIRAASERVGRATAGPRNPAYGYNEPPSIQYPLMRSFVPEQSFTTWKIDPCPHAAATCERLQMWGAMEGLRLKEVRIHGASQVSLLQQGIPCGMFRQPLYLGTAPFDYEGPLELFLEVPQRAFGQEVVAVVWANTTMHDPLSPMLGRARPYPPR